MLDEGNLRAHDAAGLDTHRIVHRDGCGDVLHVIDAQLNIGLLKGLVGRCKGGVDLRLDPLGLLDQPHQLLD